MKNKVPDRWLEYTPMGAKVSGTRFIAFKTPLSKETCAKLKSDERFTPDILMELCPNMRLIIDLTNTDRYYNKQEFIDRGIQYEKIMCPGQVIPPQSLIFRFFEIIDDFYLKNGLKDVLIGIHCTHGVNRTGYFIGRYMVQRMGFHYDKAIPCIEEARGHKIERTNYIKDLTIQVPIPSSLSSSSGKKVIEPKAEQKKVNSNSSAKTNVKTSNDRSADKPYGRNAPVDNRDPGRSRRSPDSNFRGKEPFRGGHYGQGGGRPPSPGRRVPSPGRRPYSPNRSAIPQGKRSSPPGRRPVSPGRRGGRAASPKRLRTSPRSFSPRRRSPRRSPPRRLSPPPRRENDFGPSFRSGEDREYYRSGPPRGYSPPRRNDPPASNFPPRGPPPERDNYGSSQKTGSWNTQYESRGYNSGGPPSNHAPPPNQFTDSRPDKRHMWENRSNNQPPMNESKPPYGGSGQQQWNAPPLPPHDFSRPPPNVNVPAPNFDSRSGGFNNPPPGRFNERRFEEPKFPPPREESRRNWNDERPPQTALPSFNAGGRFEENRGFAERGNDYRQRPDEKYDKPYARSPPRGEYPREKRPPSPFREFRRDFDGGQNRPDEGWDRRRSPPPHIGDRETFGRGGGKRRSRSPVRRPSPGRRSPVRRRTPPRTSGFDHRRSPPRNRPGDHASSFNQPPIHSQAPPPRPGPEPPYQDQRFYDPRDDCRDLLNQKRSFDGGDRGDFYEDSKPAKLGVRDIPKEVDLRKIIGSSGPNEPPLKHRLGPPPRDEHHPSQGDGDRKFGRGRSRSRGRSPSRYGPPRRY